jgi:hypothetical protein
MGQADGVLYRQTTVTLVSGTQEYDLETTITDYAWISKQGVSIKIVDATRTCATSKATTSN